MDKIKVFGLPFDFGQDNVGVRMAPAHLKEQGLMKRLSSFCTIEDLGEMKFPFKLPEMEGLAIKQKRKSSLANRQISESIASIDLNTSFLLNVGGDHGLGLGSVHGMLQHDPDTVVVWADAHGDINTPETSPTGNFHGMPLAFLLGEAKDSEFSWLTTKLKPQNLILFGPRDLDQGEKDIIDRLGIQHFSSEEINRMGTKEVIEMALYRADPFGKKPIHLSFDVDLFDCNDVKSTGTRVHQGPRQEEIFLMGGLLTETGRLKSMDVVEFNPLIGTEEEIEDSCELILNFLERTLQQVSLKEKALQLNQINIFSNTYSGF